VRRNCLRAFAIELKFAVALDRMLWTAAAGPGLECVSISRRMVCAIGRSRAGKPMVSKRPMNIVNQLMQAMR